MQQGFTAVSHRAVAQRARLPLSATTYYFASLDDLLGHAVTELGEAWFAAAQAVVAALPDVIADDARLADAVLRVAVPTADGGGGAGLVTFYERYLETARHPGLRPLVVRYDEHLDALLSEVLHRGGLDDSTQAARLVLAVVDGVTVRGLAEGADPADVTSQVRLLVSALRALVSPV